MIIPHTQLYQELSSLGISNIMLVDKEYYLPSKTWLTKFSKWLPSQFPPGSDESFDCDNFSLRTIDRATDLLLKRKPTGYSHTVGFCDIGIMTFLKSGLPSIGLNGIPPCIHTTNIIRTQDEWLFYEPQTRFSTSVSVAMVTGQCVVYYVRV